MWRVYALIALVWIVLLPPFFTAGARTAQFNAESDRLRSVGDRHEAIQVVSDSLHREVGGLGEVNLCR